MMGKTHAAIGANMVWILLLAPFVSDPVYLFVGGLYALLPDLDAPESIAKHIKIPISFRRKIYVKPLEPVALILNKLFRHRGMTHSLVGIVFIMILNGYLVWRFNFTLEFFVVAALGYASHIASDMLNIYGVELFWPIHTRVRLLPKALTIPLQSWKENLLFVIMLLLLVYYYFLMYPQVKFNFPQ